MKINLHTFKIFWQAKNKLETNKEVKSLLMKVKEETEKLA